MTRLFFLILKGKFIKFGGRRIHDIVYGFWFSELFSSFSDSVLLSGVRLAPSVSSTVFPGSKLSSFRADASSGYIELKLIN